VQVSLRRGDDKVCTFCSDFYHYGSFQWLNITCGKLNGLAGRNVAINSLTITPCLPYISGKCYFRSTSMWCISLILEVDDFRSAFIGACVGFLLVQCISCPKFSGRYRWLNCWVGVIAVLLWRSQRVASTADVRNSDRDDFGQWFRWGYFKIHKKEILWGQKSILIVTGFLIITKKKEKYFGGEDCHSILDRRDSSSVITLANLKLR